MSDHKILWLDIETTGIAKAYDQVVQMAYGWENEDGELVEEMSILVRPSVPISRGAFETHGISDDMVANSPTFAEAASELADRIDKAEMIATYNGNRFDIPILDAEFKRAGMSVELISKLPLDGFRLLQEMNPRDLSTMHAKYVGEPLEGAHDALADIRGTHALYRAMRSAFGLDSIPDHQFAHSLKGYNITEDGKLMWDKWNPDVIIFNYGKKHGGRPIDWVIENDPGYLNWIIIADKERFDSITVELVEIARRALNGVHDFYRWVQATYGGPPLEVHELLEKGQPSRHKRLEVPEETPATLEDTGITGVVNSDYQKEIQAQEMHNQRHTELERNCMRQLMEKSQELDKELQTRLYRSHQELDKEFQSRLHQRHQELDHEFQTRLYRSHQEIEKRAWAGELDSNSTQEEISKSTAEGNDWLREKEAEATIEENAWLREKEAEATAEGNDWLNDKKVEVEAEMQRCMDEGIERIRSDIRDQFGITY